MRLTRLHVFETNAKYIAPSIGNWVEIEKFLMSFSRVLHLIVLSGTSIFHFLDEPMSSSEFNYFHFISKWFISISCRTSAEAWYTQQQTDRLLNTLVCIDYKRTHSHRHRILFSTYSFFCVNSGRRCESDHDRQTDEQKDTRHWAASPRTQRWNGNK